MDRDSFITTLIAQYKEEVEEILVECEHVYRSTIDYELLEGKVEELLKCARVDGLEEKNCLGPASRENPLLCQLYK